MSITTIVGPKGGIGKTTLSINLTAALTHHLQSRESKNEVCLVDLDLRLPTISNLLNSHPVKTFYDLFEVLANKIYQVDFLKKLYHIISIFKEFQAGSVGVSNVMLLERFSLYKNINIDLFRYSEFKYGDLMYELFLYRETILIPEDIKKLGSILDRIDLVEFLKFIQAQREKSQFNAEEYINYIEEYGFSIIGGEVPILGKKFHKKRINEPEFLVLFLNFLCKVFKKYKYVVLDTPAGGVNHLPSLMTFIDHVIFLFDLSNNIAVNGSIDAIHSFIDYYEEFYDDFVNQKLSGYDKEYVSRLISENGESAISQSIKKKKMGIVFNRFSEVKEISYSLDKLREYLDILGKYDEYKNRINIIGVLPLHKVINIANNWGTLFYGKDKGLTKHVDDITRNLFAKQVELPNLEWSNDRIIQSLRVGSGDGFLRKISNIAGVRKKVS